MEEANTQPTLSVSDFEGLPSLNSDNTKTTTKFKKRCRPLKLKALSLPVNTKGKYGLKEISYKISDEYNLMEKLGFGTYSQVRRAIHKKTLKVCAVKISKGHTSGCLLNNEADILKTIDWENIPKYYDFQKDSLSNKSYLFMEYVKGVSLDVFIENNGTLTEDQSIELLKQLVSAVKILHSNKIAHRDIKPQNIIISEDMKLKLIDLNISKRMKESHDSDDDEGKFKSIFFTQISSPMYAAPELSLKDCYSESIDIWGIGVAFSEMLFNLSGDKLLKNKKNLPDLITELQNWSGVSNKSVNLLKSMLSSEPDLRPTIFELSDKLS